MNFVAQVEDHLRDLGAEARKTHPGVKEASERAILHLRSLQTQYVAAVRRAGASSMRNKSTSTSTKSCTTVSSASEPATSAQVDETQSTQQKKNQQQSQQPPQHPTTALFRSQEILHPFLLALNHPEAPHSLVVIALESIQLLLMGSAVGGGGSGATGKAVGAVRSEDGAQISRVLGIQARALRNNGRLGLVSSGGSVGGAVSSGVSGALGGITNMVLGSASAASTLGSTSGSHSHPQSKHAHSRTAKEDQSIALKILQIITMLADSRSMELSQEVLGSCLLACLLLGAGQHLNDGSTKDGIGAAASSASLSNAAKDYALSYSSSLLGYHHISNASEGESTTAPHGGKGSGASAAGNVRRAALATMNQLISIVFERSRDVMTGQFVTSLQQLDITHDESTILTVASSTLSDLCFLIKQSALREQGEQQKLGGPFVIASKEGLVPSTTTCLALLDSIFKQRCGDFFHVCRSSIDESHQMQGQSAPGVEFAYRNIVEACQLVSITLKAQYTQIYRSQQSASNLPTTASSKALDFCFFYYAASLATKILTTYLVSCSVEFYAKFDDISVEKRDVSKDGDKTNMSNLSRDMMKLLVSFVSAATDAYHKSDVFEDGYIFSQTERETLNIGKTDITNIHGGISSHRGLSSRAAAHEPPTPTIPDPLISNEQLWRAFLSLEVLHCLVRSNLKELACFDSIDSLSKPAENENIIECESVQSENQGSKMSIVSFVAEAASDFATISASSREYILHVVITAHDDRNTKQSLPMNKNQGQVVSTNAGHPASGNSTLSKDTESFSSAESLAARFTDAFAPETAELPICDTGAATWLAFKCVLSLLHSMKSTVKSEVSDIQDRVIDRSKIIELLLNGSFAPSVSVLQHYIKRMYGSHVVVSETLCAYEELAYSSMMMDRQPENLRRHAILTSLCKLCLPSWGKKRAHCQLKECNVDTLWTLIWMVHSHFDEIFDEWHAILSTLDQLATIPLTSSKLPATYTGKVTAIAKCLIQFPEFTTCFSSESLSYFIKSLVKLSESSSFGPVLEQSVDLARSNSSISQSESFEYNQIGESNSDKFSKEPTLGGKLMSFAGRAFGGTGQPVQPSSSGNAPFQRSNSDLGDSRFSKTYSDDFREAASKRMASMKMSSSRSVFRKLPLPLLLMTLATDSNSYRFSVIEETVATHLCEVVEKSSSLELRTFAMDVLIYFMPLSISGPETFLSFGIGPKSSPAINDATNNPFDLAPTSDAAMSKAQESPQQCELQLLTRLCETIRSTNRVETAENGLNAIHIVLEGTGHNLSGGNLITVVNTLSKLSGSDYGQDEVSKAINRSTKPWANASAIAFQNLKLIFDELLEPTSASDLETREAILDCCVSFGKSLHDINTSLTATGMLWSLADQDSTPGTIDLVLSKLAFLALDHRPEVRNCSVNTVFSCVVGLGQRFTDEQWKKCFDETIFGVLGGISSAIHESEEQTPKLNEGSLPQQRYKVAVHHTRDSSSKQWATTQVLALRGLERVLRLFFPRLLSTTSISKQTKGDEQLPWFVEAWKKLLRVSLDCATMVGERETLEMRLAGIELITLCAQLSCKRGIGVAATARVGTNMEVVGGALRSVRAATTAEDTVQETQDAKILMEPEVNVWRQNAFDSSFSSLDDFRICLKQNEPNDSSGSEYQYTDSVLTQVLSKLSGELTKLYECCKNDEMRPGTYELQLELISRNTSNIELKDSASYENRLINLLLLLVVKVDSDKKSRYLNQVQRGVMSLLQSMASNSSLAAFRALITLSGDSMFVQSKAVSGQNSDTEEEEGYGEVFELEAANTVANAFQSDEMSNEAKVVVMCSVLSQYLALYGSSEGSKDSLPKLVNKKSSDARYDILTSFIDSGLEATAQLKYTDGVVFDFLWDKIIATMSSLLLPSSCNEYYGYAFHSKSFLNIITIILLHLPANKYGIAESMLEKGANRAVEVALENDKEIHEQSIPSSKIIDGAVDVFLACFMGLCQKMPSCLAVSTLTNQILGKTLEAAETSVGDADQERNSRQSLALAVCESLSTASSDLLIGIFPLLCRLTNVESDSLRRAAGKVLGGMNLADAISRERQRADQSEIKAKEIEEENNALLEEIEYLQAENEELQRQLAVFSESSDFT